MRVRLSSFLIPFALVGCGGGDGSPDPLTLECGQAELHAVEHDACAAMDVESAPDEQGQHCRCILGWAWNGTDCVTIGDCRCRGADCDKLAETEEECALAHLACGTPLALVCGDPRLHSVAPDACEAMDAVAAPDDNGHCTCALGYAWDGSACVLLGDCQCVGDDCDGLSETIEACQAAHSACGDPPRGCGDAALYAATHSACAAMDAAAVGDGDQHCFCFLGFAWNGSACEMLGDCACEGADCDKLTETIEECEADHVSCR